MPTAVDRLTDNITFSVQSPYSEGVPELITELDRYQRSLYPPENNFLLDIEGLAEDSVTFFVARKIGQAVGIGALLDTGNGYGEVKRMYVKPDERRQNIGGRILYLVESAARRQGQTMLRLETGVYQPDAIELYTRAGFSECGPFGDYPEHPLNVFMEKPLI